MKTPYEISNHHNDCVCNTCKVLVKYMPIILEEFRQTEKISYPCKHNVVSYCGICEYKIDTN